MAKKKDTIVLPETLPRHVAFIMDGNGRWAKRRGLPRVVGHSEGAKVFRKMIMYCRDIGIEYISFYAFSTENWKRAENEVSGLMKLFRQELAYLKTRTDKDVRMVFVGDLSAFDQDISEGMQSCAERMRDYIGTTALVCANYGSRDEITHACRKIAAEVAAGKLSPDDITEQTVNDHLYTAEFPDVDLLIRPSGELRISNFLLWQSAYAELYFTDTLWPDFDSTELDKALVEYSKRGRRFGGVDAG